MAPLDGRPDDFVSGPQLGRAGDAPSAKQADERFFEVEAMLSGVRRDLKKLQGDFNLIQSGKPQVGPPPAPTLDIDAGPPTGVNHWLQKNYTEEWSDDAIYPYVLLRAKLNGAQITESGVQLVIAVWDKTQARGYQLGSDLSGTDCAAGYDDQFWGSSGLQIGDECYCVLVALANAAGFSETVYGETERPFTVGNQTEAPEAPLIVRRWRRERTTRFAAVFVNRPDVTTDWPEANNCNLYESMEAWSRGSDGSGIDPEQSDADGWEQENTWPLKRIVKALTRARWPTDYPITDPTDGSGTWGTSGSDRTFTVSGTPWTAHAYIGHLFVCEFSGKERYWLILDNTTSVLTLDTLESTEPVTGKWSAGTGGFLFTPDAPVAWQDEQWEGQLAMCETAVGSGVYVAYALSDSDSGTTSTLFTSGTVSPATAGTSVKVYIPGPADATVSNGRVHRFWWGGAGTASGRVWTPTTAPNWITNQWAGYFLCTNLGQARRILSNTGTTVTTATGAKLETGTTAAYIRKLPVVKKFVVEHIDGDHVHVAARITDKLKRVGSWRSTAAVYSARPLPPVVTSKPWAADYDTYEVAVDPLETDAKLAEYSELEVFKAPAGTTYRVITGRTWTVEVSGNIVTGTGTYWDTAGHADKLNANLTVSFGDDSNDAYAYDISEIKDDTCMILVEPYGTGGEGTTTFSGTMSAGFPDDSKRTDVTWGDGSLGAWREKPERNIRRPAKRGKRKWRVQIFRDNLGDPKKEVAFRWCDIYDQTSALATLDPDLQVMVLLNSSAVDGGVFKVTTSGWERTGYASIYTGAATNVKGICGHPTSGRIYMAFYRSMSSVDRTVRNYYYTDDYGANWNNNVEGPITSLTPYQYNYAPLYITCSQYGKVWVIQQYYDTTSHYYVWKEGTTWTKYKVLKRDGITEITPTGIAPSPYRPNSCWAYISGLITSKTPNAVTEGTVTTITTSTAHGFSSGDPIHLTGFIDEGGLLNGFTFRITITGTDTFTVPVDTSALTITTDVSTRATFYSGLYYCHNAEEIYTGTELIINGAFTSGATGWTLGDGTWAIGSGVATATTSSSTLAQTASTIESGAWYTLTFTCTRTAGSFVVTAGGWVSATIAASSTGYRVEFLTSNTDALTFTGTGFSGTIDNISLVKAAPSFHSYTMPPVTGIAVYRYVPSTTVDGTIWACSTKGLYKSADWGLTWGANVAPTGAFTTEKVMDFVQRGGTYWCVGDAVAGGCSIWKRTIEPADGTVGGATGWNGVADPDGPLAQTLTQLAFDPFQATRVTVLGGEASSEGLYQSVDTGATWTAGGNTVADLYNQTDSTDIMLPSIAYKVPDPAGLTPVIVAHYMAARSS